LALQTLLPAMDLLFGIVSSRFASLFCTKALACQACRIWLKLNRARFQSPRMRSWNDYRLEQWGLDDADVAAEFGDYMRRLARRAGWHCALTGSIVLPPGSKTLQGSATSARRFTQESG
jgi:hypothetical protein